MGTVKRKISTVLALSAITVGGSAVVATAPAFAVATQVINRSNCLWTAEVWGYKAETRRSSPNDCAGHGWVQVKVNGTWSGWVHDLTKAKIEPAGTITESRHKTCADCGYITLKP